MSNFGFAQACSSSNSSFTTVVLRSCGQVSRIPPPPPPPCTEFNNFKYRVRRRFQSPSYLRRSSLHSACSHSLPFPLASSVSASRGSFSGYRRRKLEVRASASELFQQEHGEGKPTESAETPDIAPQSLRNDPASELKVGFSSTFALNCCEQHSPRYTLWYIFRGKTNNLFTSQVIDVNKKPYCALYLLTLCCRELDQIYRLCCGGSGRWQLPTGVQKIKCRRVYGWRACLHSLWLQLASALDSIFLDETLIMLLQVRVIRGIECCVFVFRVWSFHRLA